MTLLCTFLVIHHTEAHTHSNYWNSSDRRTDYNYQGHMPVRNLIAAPFSNIVADDAYKRAISVTAGADIEGHIDTAKERPSSD
jgi:hypothetical protein